MTPDNETSIMLQSMTHAFHTDPDTKALLPCFGLLCFLLAGCFSWKTFELDHPVTRFITGYKTGYLPFDVRVILHNDTVSFPEGKCRIGEDDLGLFLQGEAVLPRKPSLWKVEIPFEDVREIRYGLEARFLDAQGRKYPFRKFGWAVRVHDGWPDAIVGESVAYDRKTKHNETRRVTIPLSELQSVDLFDFDAETTGDILSSILDAALRGKK